MKKPKILVIVRGGIVTAVYTETEADIEILDADTDGVAEEELITLDYPYHPSEKMYVYKNEVNIVDSVHIEDVYGDIAKHREKVT